MSAAAVFLAGLWCGGLVAGFVWLGLGGLFARSMTAKHAGPEQGADEERLP